MIINQFVEKLIFQIINLNVYYESQLFEQFFESSSFFEQYEYASQNNVIQRRLARIFIFNLTMKKLIKFRKFFDVFFSLQLSSNVDQKKIDHLLKRTREQKNVSIILLMHKTHKIIFSKSITEKQTIE